MNTPAYADTTLGTLVTAKQEAAAQDTGQVAAAARPDCLFVIGNLGIGGSERKIVRLANRLKQDGVHVALACMNGPFTIESSIRRDVPCLKLERKGKFSWATVFRLRDILVRQQPATVLALNLYQALYVALASMFLPYRPRKVALVNTSFFRGHRMLMRFYHWVLLQFDVIVHGSEAQRRFWFKPGSSAWNKSVVVYNGVDSDCFEITASFEAGKRLRESLGVKPEAMLIGTVGMCRPEKNQQVLLTMLRRLRVARVDAHLVIAGGAFLIEQLKRRAVELEISDRVHFLGETEDVRPVLAAMDLFVLPSIAVESFSNAALEAMSMGRPVILSEIGGAREMITDGVEGYVVTPTELAARLPAIAAALYADKRKRLQMGQAARARAVSCFSVSSMVAGYRALFHGESS
jgi:glycosyltransferase involved in cell wall biosynthesis